MNGWDSVMEKYYSFNINKPREEVLDYVIKAMTECGLDNEIETMRKDAMSFDKTHFSIVCNSYLFKCNEIKNRLQVLNEGGMTLA